MIVDGHLDIAFNALVEGRPFAGEPSAGYLVSEASLGRSGVGLVFATMFAPPDEGLAKRLAGQNVYRTPHEAYLAARAQLGFYRAIGFPLLHSAAEVRVWADQWTPGRIAGVLLMEGADPIEEPTQLEHWFGLGLRIIGPAWSRTRYSGGTWGEGGLTELGHQLLEEMSRLGLILDISHMSDQALEDSFAAWRGPVIASHSNARELVPAVRQIPQHTAAEIGARGGVIGVALAANMLAQGRRSTLEDVVDHIVHHARSAGGPEHVALGTDLDGGFPTTNAPIKKLEELEELPRLLAGHFSPAQVDGIMGENWLTFLYRCLPSAA